MEDMKKSFGKTLSNYVQDGNEKDCLLGKFLLGFATPECYASKGHKICASTLLIDVSSNAQPRKNDATTVPRVLLGYLNSENDGK